MVVLRFVVVFALVGVDVAGLLRVVEDGFDALARVDEEVRALEVFAGALAGVSRLAGAGFAAAVDVDLFAPLERLTPWAVSINVLFVREEVFLRTAMLTNLRVDDVGVRLILLRLDANILRKTLKRTANNLYRTGDTMA